MEKKSFDYRLAIENEEWPLEQIGLRNCILELIHQKKFHTPTPLLVYVDRAPKINH